VEDSITVHRNVCPNRLHMLLARAIPNRLTGRVRQQILQPGISRNRPITGKTSVHGSRKEFDRALGLPKVGEATGSIEQFFRALFAVCEHALKNGQWRASLA
jgi:hypothetical protein